MTTALENVRALAAAADELLMHDGDILLIKPMAGDEHDELLDRATRWALISIAESLHEANIETRARDMINARARNYYEWAGHRLRQEIIRRLTDPPNENLDPDARPSMAERIADLIVGDFRRACWKSIDPPLDEPL